MVAAGALELIFELKYMVAIYRRKEDKPKEDNTKEDK
jgi:hypothetical protein